MPYIVGDWCIYIDLYEGVSYPYLDHCTTISMQKTNQVGTYEGVWRISVWARDSFLRRVCTRLSALMGGRARASIAKRRETCDRVSISWCMLLAESIEDPHQDFLRRNSTRYLFRKRYLSTFFVWWSMWFVGQIRPAHGDARTSIALQKIGRTAADMCSWEDVDAPTSFGFVMIPPTQKVMCHQSRVMSWWFVGILSGRS